MSSETRRFVNCANDWPWSFRNTLPAQGSIRLTLAYGSINWLAMI
jgi:hypothetical protein